MKRFNIFKLIKDREKAKKDNILWFEQMTKDGKNYISKNKNHPEKVSPNNNV